MINGTGKWLWVWALCLLMPFCQAAPATESAAAPSSQLASVRTLSFRQMGAGSALRLRGGNAIATIGFGSRADELVTSLTLKLRYIYSPAMLTDLSHVQVIVNDQVVAVLPFAKDQGGRAQEASLTLDPRLLTSFNRIQFRLIGHYTLRCEDETNSSIWAEISNGSEIQMTTQALSMANDLVYFPSPFLRARLLAAGAAHGVRRRPSLGALQAAGELASWFGALSGWRGARFPRCWTACRLRATPSFSPPMASGRVPEGPAAGVGADDRRDVPSLPAGVQAAGADGPGRPGSAAGRARAGAGTGWHERRHGPGGQVRLVAPRKPYDAPNWVRSDGPTRLGSLAARKEDLQVSGVQLAPIRVAFRVPGDLFTWVAAAFRSI
ncbi:Cellulose synthase regulatory subunit [Chromobacterium violaceum]|uniref:Cyclic di-GMP-binding protein n=1 Tax=Chromobacterium violaceum TaxID=536 RepID=A0A3S4HJD1_CHRVL|nr:Cellulose synthase regulatory subunit [Chromobacterium violaceum]